MAPPANDDFANATVIAGASGTASVDVTDATNELGEPFAADYHQTAWYEWTAPADGAIRFFNEAAAVGRVISNAVFTGATLGALVHETSGFANTGTGERHTAHFVAVSGTVYKIQLSVFDTPAMSGTIAMRWEMVDPPANDDFANALALTDGDQVGPIDAFAATVEVTEPSGSLIFPDPPTQSTWYTWTAPDDGRTVVDLTGSLSKDYPDVAFGDWVSTVWTGSTLGTLVEVASVAAFSFPDTRLAWHAEKGVTYHIQINTFGDQDPATVRLVLTQTARGVSLAIGEPMLKPDPAWTRLDGSGSNIRIQQIHVRRGRSDEKEKTGAGTATISGIDLDGSLDPTNPVSLYVGAADPRTQASVSLQNPVTGATHSLFRGYTADLTYDIDISGKFATFELELVDALDLLADTEVIPDRAGVTVPDGSEGDVYYTGQQVDDRILAALADAAVSAGVTEWPAELTRIFSGNVAVQGTVYAPRTSILQVIQDAADAEFPGVSNFYVDKTGVVTFHGRYARFHPDVVQYEIETWKLGDGAAFDDDDEVAVIAGLQFTRGKANLINAALATPTGIADADIAGQFVSDATSIAQSGASSISFENLITGEGDEIVPLDALEETHLFAEYYVSNYKTPRNRVKQIRVRIPGRQEWATNIWKLMTEVEIGDLIALKTTHPGGGGFDEDFYVEGISYEITPATDAYPDVTLALDVSPRAYFTEFPGDPDA